MRTLLIVLLTALAPAGLVLASAGCAKDVRPRLERVRTRSSGQDARGSVGGVEIGVGRDSRSGDVSVDIWNPGR